VSCELWDRLRCNLRRRRTKSNDGTSLAANPTCIETKPNTEVWRLSREIRERNRKEDSSILTWEVVTGSIRENRNIYRGLGGNPIRKLDTKRGGRVRMLGRIEGQK